MTEPKTTRWTVAIQESDDDYYIELPPEVWDELGWTVGDTLTWTEQDEGSWSIRKAT